MLIKRVVLQDFGLYRGEQVFDLTPRAVRGGRKPIILIGGNNGVGKTTLLEAVRLCLYGRLALGGRVRAVDYEEYLLGRIHRGDDLLIRPASASVTLEFDYSNRGVRENYVVRRSWERKPGNSGVGSERVLVLRNGDALPDVQAELWSDFVQGLVPPAVGSLFFFDAEHIRELAEDDTDAEMLAQAVKSLLGLDHVERLVADLDIYATRQARTGSDRKLRRSMDEAIRRSADLDQQVRALRGKRAEEQRRLDYATAQVERAERELAQQGHGFTQQQSATKARKEVVESSAAAIEADLRRLCEGVLPVAFCPKVADALRAQLLGERDARNIDALKARAGTLTAAVRKKLASSETWRGLRIGKQTRDAIRKRVAEVVESELGGLPRLQVERLHGLAGGEEDRVLSWLDQARGHTLTQAQDLGHQLERADREQQSLARRMAQVPADDAIHAHVARLRELATERGQVEQIIRATDERLAELERELEQCRRSLNKMTQAVAGSDEMKGRLGLVGKMTKAAVEYGTELTDAKLARLEGAVAASFNELCQKGEEIRGVTIDRRTFKVSLIDKLGRSLPKQALSQGEKQIYAVSVLNALARTSGRHIPVIVDTPLGRLDNAHRGLLVTRYFPNASHQVVLLSTDTEVDIEYCKKLAPHLSHALTVRYRSEGGWSEVTPGYFWDSERRDARATG